MMQRCTPASTGTGGSSAWMRMWTPGQFQCDLGYVVDGRVADVPHGDSSVCVALLDLDEALGGWQVRTRPDADIFGAELFQEQELFVGGRRRRLHAELDRGHGF